MEDTDDAVLPRFGDHRLGVFLGVAGVDDDGFVELFGEGELRGEDAALDVAWGVIVMIVQAALADG